MRVEPQHEQRPPGFGGMARHAGNAAHRQAVVAAEEDRECAALHRAVGGFFDGPRPAGDLGRIARSTLEPDCRVGDGHDIAAVGDIEAERRQRCFDVGDPQRLRTHDAAAAAGAHVDRRADQIDIPVSLCHVPTLFDGEYRAAAYSQIDEKLAI